MGDRYKVLGAEKNGVELIDVTEVDLRAQNTFYDNTESELLATDVQGALDELKNITEALVPKIAYTPVSFWEWNTNSGTFYLFHDSQLRCTTTPFVMPQNGYLRKIIFSGSINDTSNGSNSMFGIYKINTAQNALPVIGVHAQVTNRYVIYYSADYGGLETPVTVVLQNNGASRPLAFSENLLTKTVTIQLATNSSGTVTTTSSILVTAFRKEQTITLLWKLVLGAGNQTLAPATFQVTGGSQGDSISTIFNRGTTKNYTIRELENVYIEKEKTILVYSHPYYGAAHSSPLVKLYFDFV